MCGRHEAGGSIHMTTLPTETKKKTTEKADKDQSERENTVRAREQKQCLCAEKYCVHVQV